MPDATLDQLAAYLAVLAQWNQRINLTAFALASPTDDAIDRLLVEPLVAARQILDSDRLLIDIGSGGGSPAIPLRIAAPWLRVVLVESKVRKCAFLREAVRTIGLANVDVENRRAEDLLDDLGATADVVTIRAVRADAELWATTEGLLKSGGRVFWFTTAAVLGAGKLPEAFEIKASETLQSAERGRLAVLHKVN